MTDLYSEWRDFYAEKVRSWMSLEEQFEEVDAASNTIEAIRNRLGVKND